MADLELQRSREKILKSLGTGGEINDKLQVVYSYNHVDAMKTLSEALLRSTLLNERDEILISANCSTSTKRTLALNCMRNNQSQPPIVVQSETTTEQPAIDDYLCFMNSNVRLVVLPLFCKKSGAIANLQSLLPFLKGLGVHVILDLSSDHGGLQIGLNDLKHFLSVLKIDFIIWGSGSGAIIIGNEQLFDQLPPVVGGDRTFVHNYYESSNRKVKKHEDFLFKNERFWTDSPNRFECETSITPVALSCTAAFLAVMGLAPQTNSDITLKDMLCRLQQGIDTMNAKQREQSSDALVKLYQTTLFNDIYDQIEDPNSLSISFSISGMSAELIANQFLSDNIFVDGYEAKESQEEGDQFILLYIDRRLHSMNDIDIFLERLYTIISSHSSLTLSR